MGIYVQPLFRGFPKQIHIQMKVNKGQSQTTNVQPEAQSNLILTSSTQIHERTLPGRTYDWGGPLTFTCPGFDCFPGRLHNLWTPLNWERRRFGKHLSSRIPWAKIILAAGVTHAVGMLPV